MEPRFEMLPPKVLVGQHLTMTYASNRTAELWGRFMPRRREVTQTVDGNLYSLQVFGDDFDFQKFDPLKDFEKWAAVEVSSAGDIPDGMDAFLLQGGLYAVFTYKGAASQGAKFFQYIFGTWLPNSEYLLDNRPHFEILGEKYRNDHPDSEEEVWIPVRPR